MIPGKAAVLVTGSTGFVGAAVAGAILYNTGHQVYGLKRKTSDTKRIRQFCGGIKLIDADLADARAVSSIIRRIRPVAVIHTAAYGGFSEQSSVSAAVEVNSTGTFNLLDSALSAGVKLFINTGSSSEYGIKNTAMRESDVCQPLSIYGATKLAATAMTGAFAGNRMDTVTLRLFSPYGPGDDGRRLIPQLVISAIDGVRLELSDPGIVRDYVYISDVAGAYIRALKGSRFGGAVINIGAGRQTTIGRTAAIIERCSGRKGRFLWNSRKRSALEPAVWKADISTAADKLGWRPVVTLERGLALTAGWIRNNRPFYA